MPALVRTSVLSAVLFVALSLWTQGMAGAGSTPTVALFGPDTPVSPVDTFAVTVSGANLPPLGAYEVVVSFNDVSLEFVAGSDSGFLGSTGRNVSCFPPIVSTNEARFGCATTGSAAGPGGDGTLAQIYFKALSSGQTEIALRDAGLADEFGNNAGSADLRGASITIEGTGDGEPKPTETSTPDTTRPHDTPTIAFVPPVGTPTFTVPMNTAIPTATNTRAANTATPASNSSTPAAASTPTLPSGAIAGSAPISSANGVLGSSRAPAGIALPETGGGAGNSGHRSRLLLFIPALFLLVPALALRRRAR